RRTQELVERVADANSLAGADVVRLASRSMRREGSVRSDDIPNVVQIAASVEISDANRRLDPARFGERDLPGEIRDRECRILPRSDVIEGTRDDDVQVVVMRRGEREVILG